ncbi:TPA: replication protein [Enterococcus faecium]|nr:replication protein [Enterococcus faecium]
MHNKRRPKITNEGKQRQYISREKTPKWLEDLTYKNKEHETDDPQFEKEREAFLKQLKVNWGE